MSPRACNSPAYRAAPPAHRWVHRDRHRTKRDFDRRDSSRTDCCPPHRLTAFRWPLTLQRRMRPRPRFRLLRRPRSPPRRRHRLRRNREPRLPQRPGRYRSKCCYEPSSVSFLSLFQQACAHLRAVTGSSGPCDACKSPPEDPRNREILPADEALRLARCFQSNHSVDAGHPKVAASSSAADPPPTRRAIHPPDPSGPPRPAIVPTTS
jgi:hypothetical protein